MVDIMVILEALLYLVGAGVGVVAMVALNKVADKFNVDIDGKRNDLIDQAIERGIAFAKQKLVERGTDLDFKTENEFVLSVIEYVIQGVPKALTHFGLTPERVEEMVRSRIAGQLPRPKPEDVAEAPEAE